MDFKVGDTITYYDVLGDEYVSRPILFIHEGWAVVPREKVPEGGCPVSVAKLEGAQPHISDPIKPGDKVRGGFASGHGVVVAVDGLSAWVRWPSDSEGGGCVQSLSQLDHAR